MNTVNPTDARDLDLLELIDAAAQAAALLDRSLARIGVGCEELRVLSVIGAAGPGGVSIGTAARDLSVSSSTALRRVRPLEKLGWIEPRGPMTFALTASGRALEAEGREICADVSERLWAARPSMSEEGMIKGGAAKKDALAGLLGRMDPVSRQR